MPIRKKTEAALKVSVVAMGVACLTAAVQPAQAELYGYDPFLSSDGGSATEYDINFVNTWQTGTLDGQNPQTTGFDGTTAWDGTSSYYAQASGLSYANGRVLVTSGGAAHINDVSVSRVVTRVMTPAVEADLDVVYCSSLIRYESALTTGYVAMGIGTSSSDRALIWGAIQGSTAAHLQHGIGPNTYIGQYATQRWGDFLPSSSTVYLYVAKIEMNASGNNEKITVFVNPDLSKDEAGNASAIGLNQYASYDVLSNSSDIDRFSFYSYEPYSTTFDEMRIGSTWEDVTPTIQQGAVFIIQ